MKLLIIYLLNIFDLFCTLVLLGTGIFEEANPLMKNIINNVDITIFIKVFIIGTILLFIARYIKRDYKIANRLINITLISYICVSILHLYYILGYIV